MLASQSIPNLFNGVSQQPATLRHSSQAELQENAYSSAAVGLHPRAPTIHIAKLNSITDPNAFCHTMNRDISSRYKLILTNGAIRVYDLLTGAAQTMVTPDGVGYLACTTARDDFRAVTVADYTFIVNKTITVAMLAATVSGSLTGTVQDYGSLPTGPTTGDIYEIQGTPGDTFDSYYVKFNGTVWVECARPGQVYKLDPDTMPYSLVRTGASTFTFKRTTWDDRLVGDLVSMPEPTFVGRKLNNIFFHRNRLGVLSDEAVILSQIGKYFNFWGETATAVLDSDPIDESSTSTKVAILHDAVPFDGALMLFSDQGQFELTGDPTLTPKTVKISEVTGFASNNLCQPVGGGSTLYFALDRGSYTAIREYFVKYTATNNDATDVTSHVPKYIPSGAFKLAINTTDDLFLCLTTNERNAVYIYKYLWSDAAQSQYATSTKVQMSWSKFTFDSGDVVLNVDFIGSIAYFAIQRADGIYLESMDFTEGASDAGIGFLVRLDRRMTMSGSYSAGFTTWTLPYADDGNFVVVRGPVFGVNAGNSVVTTRPSSTTIRAAGDYSAGPCIVGRSYTMRYRFSTQYIRDQASNAILSAVLMLKRMFITFTRTARFKVEVTPRARDTLTNLFTGKTIGASTFLLGSTAINDGVVHFNVKTKNTNATIDLVCDSYLPAFFQSAEWEGEYTAKSRRV